MRKSRINPWMVWNEDKHFSVQERQAIMNLMDAFEGRPEGEYLKDRIRTNQGRWG